MERSPKAKWDCIGLPWAGEAGNPMYSMGGLLYRY